MSPPRALRQRPRIARGRRLEARFLVAVVLVGAVPLTVAIVARTMLLQHQLTELVSSQYRSEAMQVARAFAVTLDEVARRAEVLSSLPQVRRAASLSTQIGRERVSAKIAGVEPPNSDLVERQQELLIQLLAQVCETNGDAVARIELTDADGALVATSDRGVAPSELARRSSAPPQALPSVESHRVFGRLAFDPVRGRSEIPVDVPVVDEGRLVGALRLTVSANDFLRLLPPEEGRTRERVGLVSDDGDFVSSADRSTVKLSPEQLRDLIEQEDNDELRLHRIPGSSEEYATGVAPVLPARGSDAGVRYFVVLCYPREVAHAAVDRVWAGFLGSTFAQLAIIGVAMLWVVRSIVRPIRMLRLRVEALKSGVTTLPEVPRTRDDIEELATSFDELVLDLRSSRDRLEMARDQLEDRVAARTQDLGAEREKLARSEHTLRAVLESAQDGILSIDRHGRIRSANGTAARILRVSMDDLVGQSLDAVFTPRAGESSTGALDVLHSSRGKLAALEAIRGDGLKIPVEVSFGEVSVEEELYTGVFRDVSERYRVEQMKSNFVSTVSHELRTPLTSIRGALGLLAGGAVGSMPSKANPLLAIGIQNADRLIRLIQDLLDIEKIESGKIRLHVVPANFAELARRAIEGIEPVARAGAVSVVAEVTPSWVLADHDRVVQVLTNLLSNALKFSPAGSSIEVRAAEINEDEIEVSVTDHGRGIPEDFLQRIFGRFEQADNTDARQRGGTGLGLAISKGIVEEHGGRIGVRSREGVGSTFWFTLRRAPMLDTADSPALG